MNTRILTFDLQADGKPERLSTLLCMGGSAHLLFCSSTLTLPIELISDRSQDSPARLLDPGGERALWLSRLPIHPGCLSLRLRPRHAPEEVLADQAAPASATDGIEVHDLESLRLWVSGGGTAQLLLWAWSGDAWVPLSSPTPVPTAGLVVDVPIRGVLRVAAQLTGVAGSLRLRWSVSASPTEKAQVVVEVWEA